MGWGSAIFTMPLSPKCNMSRFSMAVITHVVYGHHIMSDDDPYVKIAKDSGYVLSDGGPPGSTPVDFFPFFQKFPQWFPGTYYAGFARNNRWIIDKLHDYPFDKVSEQMAEGNAKPSFLSTNLEEYNRDGPDHPNTIADIKGAAGQMYCVAADTTWSTLSIFFLAMVLNTEAQKHAQKEINLVIGSGRLPEFKDRSALPYFECVLQETFRWNAAVPLGIPHQSLEDDIYEGMFIPKGSLVISNTRIYNNPFTFNPARFLPKPEGNAEPHPNGPFGFGKRTKAYYTLGIVLVVTLPTRVRITMVSVLATFDISKAVDERGIEITPDVLFASGLTNHPRLYRCHIQPRSEAAKALISRIDTSDMY
ncbi:cytochrome P450 [Collybia nuda]|uniref:Cytochrome P450 n=1 Tax=Collybia nuda TaxID=64659 RepID=A0A9P6CES9_9AGAR|nr:cytochrome P450 [Collybia nuda]